MNRYIAATKDTVFGMVTARNIAAATFLARHRWPGCGCVPWDQAPAAMQAAACPNSAAPIYRSTSSDLDLGSKIQAGQTLT